MTNGDPLIPELPAFETRQRLARRGGTGRSGAPDARRLQGAARSRHLRLRRARLARGARARRPQVALEFAGKRGGKPSPSQRDISLRLIELARLGKKVLRLKGGDPFVFGRGAEEARALAKAGVKFRVVPGVTAGIGGLAYAGIPATARETNHALILATGHLAEGAQGTADFAALAATGAPLILYMAMSNLEGDRQGADRGRHEPRHAARDRERGDDAAPARARDEARRARAPKRRRKGLRRPPSWRSARSWTCARTLAPFAVTLARRRRRPNRRRRSAREGVLASSSRRRARARARRR